MHGRCQTEKEGSTLAWTSYNRIRRGKRPAHLRKQHREPHAPEHGLDTWFGPRTRWQGAGRAHSSHAEAKGIGTWISTTKKHSRSPQHLHPRLGDIHLRRNTSQFCFACSVSRCSEITAQLLFVEQKSTRPQTCHASFLTASSPRQQRCAFIPAHGAQVQTIPFKCCQQLSAVFRYKEQLISLIYFDGKCQ